MIEVFICNYLWASLAGFSSFALSFSITNQILYNNQNNIIQNYDSIHLENKNKFKNLVVNYENDKYKSNSVSFKKETDIFFIPTIQEISEKEKNKLWYTKQDYTNFKKDFIINSNI